MLYTNLLHIETAAEHARSVSDNENVMVICGRMGPMCIPVYRIAEELKVKYKHVKFFDLEFDNTESHIIRNIPEVQEFKGLPFTVYYKKGKVVKATSGIQSEVQIMSILEKVFAEIPPDSEVSSKLNINGIFPFCSEMKSNVSVRSIDFTGKDQGVFSLS